MTAPMTAPDTLSIDVVVESPLWDVAAIEPVLHHALHEAAAAVSTNAAEIAIVLSDDSAVRVLNRKWRGIDRPTNVLSFPIQAMPRGNSLEQRRAAPVLLGDIVVAYETTAEEARNEGKPFVHHVAHLAVHGFLHLVGFDHENDSDAATMEGLERSILARLGIADPYGAGDPVAAVSPHA